MSMEYEIIPTTQKNKKAPHTVTLFGINSNTRSHRSENDLIRISKLLVNNNTDYLNALIQLMNDNLNLIKTDTELGIHKKIYSMEAYQNLIEDLMILSEKNLINEEDESQYHQTLVEFK